MEDNIKVLKKNSNTKSKFKKNDGLIFRPIENNKSSTPNSAGKLRRLFESPILK